MITKQKLILIATIILATILVSLLTAFRIWGPENKNTEAYTEALSLYNTNHYKEAYYAFGKVTKSSKLKSAAIYRQGVCSDKIGDEKTAIKKYKEVIRFYPNSKLALKSKYLTAQTLYAQKKMKKAKKEFKKIVKQYPHTDYAIAADYYLGSIEVANIPNIKDHKKKNKAINIAAHYFRAYLKEAPTGRFTNLSIKKWTSLNQKLANEDNLIIAKAYIANEQNEKAQKYLNFTNIGVSWPYFVKNAYAMKDINKVKFYTEKGLKNKNTEITINDENDEEAFNKNIYEAIDTYLKVSSNPKLALSFLLSFAQKSEGYDYIFYKSCNNMPKGAQLACYNSLYTKYPDGNFAAEALSNIFYDKIQSKDYLLAKKIGREHLSKFKQANSTPRVLFWMGKLSERMKNYEEARGYYNTLIKKFPDDYYAYHAFLNLHKVRQPVIDTNDLEGKEVVFPYKRTADNDVIIRLQEVQDYGLINELCKDDDFVQSWLAYEEGDFGTSARLARDAMEKLNPKPDRKDFRWRLVYPVHYYDTIRENALRFNNSPILILSIIREESYFDTRIKSAVGACGLMQLMPATAKEVGAKHGMNIPNEKLLFDPDINIRLGNIYYAQLRQSLLNRDALAVLAYNGGIGSVSKWKNSLNYVVIDDFVEQIPYAETQNYLKKVYRSYWNYVRIYAGE